MIGGISFESALNVAKKDVVVVVVTLPESECSLSASLSSEERSGCLLPFSMGEREGDTGSCDLDYFFGSNVSRKNNEINSSGF